MRVVVHATGYVPRHRPGEDPGAAEQRCRRRLREAMAYLLESDRAGAGEQRALFDADGSVVLDDVRARIAAHFGERAAFHRLVLSPVATPALDGPSVLYCWTRELLGATGRRIDRRLVWTAGVHGDTGTPHVHVMLAGADADGAGVILRAPLFRWMERRGAELAAAAEQIWIERADRLLGEGEAS